MAYTLNYTGEQVAQALENALTPYETTGQGTDKGMSQKAVSDAIKDAVRNRELSVVLKTIYGNTITKGNGWINSTSYKFQKASSSNPYYGGFVPISAYRGKEIKIYSHPSGGYYAFTISAPTAATTTSIVCPGYTLVSLADTESVVVIVPDSAEYLYVYMETNGDLRTPDRIEVIDYVKTSSVEELEKAVSAETTIKTLYPSELHSVGYLRSDGQFWLSSDYLGGFIDVRDFAGCKLKIVPRQRSDDNRYYLRYAFTKHAPSYKVEESILCNGCELFTYYGYSQEPIYDTIPDDANYVYFMVSSTGINFCPTSAAIVGTDSEKILLDKISSKEHSSVAQLWNYYFPIVGEDENLGGLSSATIASGGITMPVGTPITLKKLTVFDDEEFALDIAATTSDKILFYTSADNTGALSSNTTASYVLFDFVNGRISIYEAGSINVSTGVGTELEGADFTAASGQYVISIGRHKRNVFASLYNKSSRTRTSVEVVETKYPEINNEQRPAGWMLSYPSFRVNAGSPTFKRFVGTARNNLFILFQGDSYTQGYAGQYKDCWAYRAAEYFGNSATCGISGATLDKMIEQYHDSIKGKIKTDYMVISVGVNDRNSLDTDAKIAAWGAQFATYCAELVADGITPIVNRIWVEGSSTQATATLGRKMNDVIKVMGYDGADFGAVTGFPSGDPYYSSHLNYKGNQLSYEIFVNELGHMKK